MAVRWKAKYLEGQGTYLETDVLDVLNLYSI